MLYEHSIFLCFFWRASISPALLRYAGIYSTAMHSPYEIGGNQDPLHLLNMMKALYSTEILCTQDGEYPVL